MRKKCKCNYYLTTEVVIILALLSQYKNKIAFQEFDTWFMFVELIVFGVLSLLMGHWSILVAKICVKSSLFSTRFYPCIPETTSTQILVANQHAINSNNSKEALLEQQDHAPHRYCDKVIV